LGLKGQNYVG